MDIQELAKTLQQEGVDKGKEEAEKITAAAQEEARKILENAQNEKEQIIAKAKDEAGKIVESGKQNLKLASRDVLLQLKKDIEKIFSNILIKKVESAIKNEDIVKNLLQSLITQYSGEHNVKVEVPANVSKELESWLVSEMKATCKKNDSIAGFLIHDADGGAVEINAASVKDVVAPHLSDMVKAILHEEK